MSPTDALFSAEAAEGTADALFSAEAAEGTADALFSAEAAEGTADALFSAEAAVTSPVPLIEGQSGVAAPAVTPALYDAEVSHIRRAVLDRKFSHQVYLWLVDLDDLPAMPWWLRPFARFTAADHLGDPDATLRANVDGFLATRGVDLHGGRIVMLANARSLGHVFNPLSVYWCHRPDGTLECVVAEVHNTYGERHCYLLRTDEAGRASTPKEFYVSPFLTVDGEYRMLLREPDERLAVSITLRQGGASALTATLVGVRRAATPAALVRMLVRHPLTTYRTSALIRGHGVALWRRLPVIPRPKHRLPQKGVQ